MQFVHLIYNVHNVFKTDNYQIIVNVNKINTLIVVCNVFNVYLIVKLVTMDHNAKLVMILILFYQIVIALKVHLNN